jgi:NDP-sugar pyrophosphorylase family protein
VLVLAAGLGARYGGLKQLEKFGPEGRTLLEYSLADALHHGHTRAICTVLEENIPALEELLRPLRPRMAIGFAVQRLADGPTSIPAGRKKPWGTAHAVFAARHLLDAPFAVVNADDCYGAAAWTALAAVLAQHPNEAALVAYRLGKTLSPHGPVSRGVCQLDAGRLVTIREFRRIGRGEGGNIADAASGTVFSGAEPVSMNFWHLPPSFCHFLRRDGEAFFAGTADLETAEWTLPDAIGRWMAEERVAIWGTVTESPWCGITHPRDRDWVEGFLSPLSP